ncbi:E3 ubiquitin-protein ligase TRIM47-like [Osmerus eperlanus]|uniref:E3 ubiquitin-protein ligase TRIM47-like n=1 Tax=Osmerus eperlanus TaxID=29151 RepID=UPI002E0FBB3A
MTAATPLLLSEDQFLCSICLDVFTQPVSIPCGHTYCMACIGEYWGDTTNPCQCPLCKNRFSIKPELKVNTFISEMVDQFRRSATAEGSRNHHPARPGEVSCGVCTKAKLKALKSCLECQTSYCETHLEPHQRVAGLKRHQLVDPEENLEDRVCREHQMMHPEENLEDRVCRTDKMPLELFCREDQTCVCACCAGTEHTVYPCVPFQFVSEERKTLGTEIAQAKEMISERKKKIREIKKSVELCKREATREVFTGQGRSAKRSQFMKVVTEKQKAVKARAEKMIRDLEQDITHLHRRCAELQRLSNTQGHFNFIQRNVFNGFLILTTDDLSEIQVGRVRLAPLLRVKSQLEKAVASTKRLCGAQLQRLREYDTCWILLLVIFITSIILY